MRIGPLQLTLVVALMLFIKTTARLLIQYHIIDFYRTLRGRDQREMCTLNVVKYTFQVKCTLLTTKSALTVPMCTLLNKHSLWSIKYC